MKSSKVTTIFLLLLMVGTLTLSLGCGKEENKPNNEVPDVTQKEDDVVKEETTTKKVKLLSRNGVVWSENKSISAGYGASEYVTVWGDTLRLIARTWHVNTVKLAKYNGMKNADKLNTGTTIYNYSVDNNMQPGYSADKFGD